MLGGGAQYFTFLFPKSSIFFFFFFFCELVYKHVCVCVCGGGGVQMRMIDQMKGYGEVIMNIEIVNQFSIKWML